MLHDELFLSVSDTGVGIPADEQARLLKKFERGSGGRQSGAGIGIGLALVKNLIELHGGRVELLSEIIKAQESVCFLPRLSLQIIPRNPWFVKI